MKKFLFISIFIGCNIISSAIAWLPQTSNFYYYSQEAHPIPLNTSDNSTYYYSQEAHPEIFYDSKNQSYYFSQMTNEEKNRVMKLSYTRAQKNLEINKELLEKDVDWKKIEQLHREIGDIDAEIDLIYQKTIARLD